MRALALLLCLLSAQAWGVTYYIDTSCALNGDGTGASGACAASGGGAGAYNTGASWSNGAGNTTYIKRGTTVSNMATVISSATQTFDDYGDASASCALVSKSGTTFTFSVTANDVTFNDLCIAGSQSSAVVSTIAARTIFNRVTVSDNRGGGVGIRFNNASSDGAINDSTVYNIDDDGVGISTTATGTFTITNLTVYAIDLIGGTGDCIQLYDSASANLIVSGGSLTKETGNKQAIRAYTSGYVIIKNSVKITLLAAGAQGISMEGSGALSLISAYITGISGAPLVFAHTSGLTNISGNVLVGGDYGIWESHASGTATARNNTIKGQAIAGVYHTTDGAGGSFDLVNNYIDAPTNVYDAHASATTTANNNRYGPLLGAFSFIFLKSELMGATPYWRFFLGVTLVVIVVLFPRGLAGLAADARTKLRGRAP